MISKVSFTGREGLLVSATKKTANAASDYLCAGKVYSAEEKEAAAQLMKKVKTPEIKMNEYTSPYAPIDTKSAASVDFVFDSLPHGDKIDLKA